MSVLKVLGKIRKVLSKLTDWLLIGRENGWWDNYQDEIEYMKSKDPENYS